MDGIDARTTSAPTPGQSVGEKGDQIRSGIGGLGLNRWRAGVRQPSVRTRAGVPGKTRTNSEDATAGEVIDCFVFAPSEEAQQLPAAACVSVPCERAPSDLPRC